MKRMSMSVLVLATVVVVSPASSILPADGAKIEVVETRKVDLVRVTKSKRQLVLFAGGLPVKTFAIALGSNPLGHKEKEGDGRTPEGKYLLDYKKSDSAFHKAIHVSYPSPNDVANAKARGDNPGGFIMIHGQKNGFGWLDFVSQRFNWTDGCIALSNDDMDELWVLVETGTPIEILP